MTAVTKLTKLSTTTMENGFYVSKPNDVQFDTKHVRIGYNRNTDRKTTEVFMTDSQEEWTNRNRNYQATGGACFTQWCVENDNENKLDRYDDRHLDPLSTFGLMMIFGFASEQAMYSALYQFARMEECFWARRMLFLFECEHGMD